MKIMHLPAKLILHLPSSHVILDDDECPPHHYQYCEYTVSQWGTK
jgi:hypothetical protein